MVFFFCSVDLFQTEAELSIQFSVISNHGLLPHEGELIGIRFNLCASGKGVLPFDTAIRGEADDQA